MGTFPRVLALSPHTDDAEVAAGGTIARLVEEGSDVTILAFSWCENRDLQTAFKRAAKTLGAKPILLDYPRRIFDKYRQDILDDLCEQPTPDLVLLPYNQDLHQDHHIIHTEALRAFRRTSTLWGYIHHWNNPTHPNLYIKLTLNHLKTKIKALKHYTKHITKPHFFYNMQYSLASIYGLPIHTPLAEAFQVVRWIV